MSNMYMESYADAEAQFNRARNKQVGRPLNKWGYLTKDGDDYVIVLWCWGGHGGLPVCRIRRDDTIEFVMAQDDIRKMNASLSMAMNRYIPFASLRIDMGRYVIGHQRVYYHYHYDNLREHGHHYRSGLKFSMITGKCLNPKPYTPPAVDADQRKVWLADCRRLRRSVKALIRVGGMDQAYEALTQIVGSQRWSTISRGVQRDAVMPAMLEALRGGTVTNDLAHIIACYRAKASGYVGSRDPDNGKMYKSYESLLRHWSKDLRLEYGVLKP